MPSGRRIVADLRLFSRGYLRNKVGLFFSLVFPVILIMLFGAIFAGGNNGPIQVYAQNLDQGQGQYQIGDGFLKALNATNTVEMLTVDRSQDLSQYLLAHSGSPGILIPQDFSTEYLSNVTVTVTVYSNPAVTSSGIVLAVVNGVINQFNLRGTKPIIVEQSQNIKSQSLKYIDFLVPGLIGFTVLTSPMFSLVNITSDYKKSKFFKQLSLTPLTKTEWLTSKMVWYVFLSILSFLLMTAVGTYVFGADVSLTPWLIPFLIVGPLFFVSLGMLVGTVSKSVESAAVVGNLITFPMMFLSGTFFPVTQMPAYLQNVAHVLPLFYVIDGLNQAMVYNNLGQVFYDVLIMLVASVVVFVAAVTVFKWRED